MIPKTKDKDPDHLHITVTNTRPEHVPALAKLQRIVFPTLTEDEYYTEEKYLNHLKLFPEGQFVALVHYKGRQKVVGATSTFRINFDFSHIQHKFIEVVADGWFTNHDPEGEWLYGADMSVHPDYRGMRIGRRLYEARHALVRRLNLRGEIAGGMLPGYIHYHKRLTVAQYVLRVWQGRIYDPTLTMQIRNGFAIKGILYDHITDPRSNNTASLIVRENPHYQPQAATAGAGHR
ncbi:MAG TPA: GNAT family N-acetyltransferase [Oceanobacillus sp.]|nr:GNAT family N-acetyltransferase [Oceanobacillus sp.]